MILRFLFLLCLLLLGCNESKDQLQSIDQQNAIMVKSDHDAEDVVVENRDSLLKDVPPQFRNKRLKYNSLADMNKNPKLRLGMQTGFVFVDKETRRLLPGAKIEYYNSTPDMAYLVSTGKLDGFINDEPVIRYVALGVPNLAYIHAGFEPLSIVVAFPMNPAGKALRDEMNEFIVYWLPLMEHNEYNLISFQSEKYTDSAKLNITPAPDSMLRVFMTYSPLEKAVDIEPQEFATFERSGFTVVEWGGIRLK